MATAAEEEEEEEGEEEGGREEATGISGSVAGLGWVVAFACSPLVI